jgi:hypothetical protein
MTISLAEMVMTRCTAVPITIRFLEDLERIGSKAAKVTIPIQL